MEYVRVLLVLAHLMVFSAALFLVMREDLRLLRGDVRKDAELHRTAQGVALALTGLFATGLAIVWADTGFDPAEIMARPKLLAKFTVVSVLTLNGIALHFVMFPRLTGAHPIRRPRAWAALGSVMGAVSTGSWFYASFLGIAKPLTEKLGYAGFMQLYAAVLALASLAALILVLPRAEALFGAAPSEPTPAASRSGAPA